jgi:hypothetical protein
MAKLADLGEIGDIRLRTVCKLLISRILTAPLITTHH